MAKGFMDGYKTYDTSEGYGSPRDWKKAFNDRMSKEEAEEALGTDDPYVILGLKQGATKSSYTKAQIQKAYRTLAKIWHPDLNPHRVEEATMKMKKINAAYSLLIN